jgi:hypothetical protein
MWGMSVYAIVSATNVYGTSINSNSGNGAVILTIPSPPAELSNIPSLTKGNQIGLSWAEGEMNGGSPVLDYMIWSDQATNIYMPIASGLTASTYLVRGLSVGGLYSFKI